MKIDSGTIGMESARSYQSVKTSYRRFSVTEYQGGMLNANSGKENNGEQSVSNSDGNKGNLYTLQDWQNDLSIGSAGRGRLWIGQASREDSNTWNEFRQLTVRYIFELLFGDRSERINKLMEKYGLTEDTDSLQSTGGNAGSSSGNTVSGSDQLQNFMATGATIKEFRYVEETYSYEQENTAFSTVGTVRTSDGREINFNVDIGMSREFTQRFSQNLNASLSFKMCDPLVINLDTDVAQLSDQKFYFDIDADGELDEISQLGSGSGYLALDQNGDGVINDGSELFGTASGDGFADLAKYDEDGNGWIDENDAIWSKLKIWMKDENGKDVLYRLAEKGVGAICLQNAATDFTMQGANGQTNGAIRNTGVFLYENGNVGTVQHVDVAKYDRGA